MQSITDWFSMISFIASIGSLTLAIVAIWITFQVKKEADKVNEKTSDLLVEIKTDAKAISQVAMPELKAYGDSMRQFVLNGGDVKESPNANGEILNKLKELDGKIKSLSKDDDINKLKSKLLSVSNEIKNSEIKVAKSLSKQFSRPKGVEIKVPSGSSVSTSREKDTWDELLRMSIGLAGDKVTKDNYGDYWVLINAKTNKTIPKRFIVNSDVSFADIGLGVGDQLGIVIVD